MATSKLDLTSDEIIHIKCCVCLIENRTKEADNYCVDCKDYYCSPCSVKHKMYPAMRGHNLLDKADFRSLGPDGSLPSFVTQRCAQHQTEVTSMYCKEHDEVACSPCIALNHRSCKNIQYIPDDIDHLYSSTELANMTQNITKSMKTMEEIKTEKENEVKQLKESFEKEVDCVKAFRKELETLLVCIEQETIRKLKQEFDRIESRLANEIKEINKLIDDINEASSQLKKSEGNKTEEFVRIKSSKKVTNIAEDVEKEHQKRTKQTVCFVADQNIKTFFEQMEAFGKVACAKNSIKCQIDRLYKVKNKREISIKLANDTSDCDVEGSCLTGDGFLLITDLKNKKLKRLNMTTETVKDYVNLQESPRAVCLVSKKEAVVALYDTKSVQFVSLENTLTTTRSLTVSHNCWGLVHTDGKLIISDAGKNVYIHDMNGRELQRISTDAAGKSIFEDSRHITISVEEDKVFVADYGHKGVVIFDNQGKYLSTLADSFLPDSYGLCTDGRNLFVCNLQTGSIVQIGQDYKVLGELEKVGRPQSLCFDCNKTRIYITRHSNNISVLELE